MPLIDRLPLIASAAVLALGLTMLPHSAGAQTPPPLPPGGEDTGAANNDDLPVPNSRRGNNDNNDGPPPINNDDGPPPITNDDGPPPVNNDDGPPPRPQLAYYVLIGSDQIGPLDEAGLIGLIKGGKLTAQTKVWTKGMADWDAAGNVGDLATLLEQNVVGGPPDPPKGPQYFVLVNGQQVGPLTPDQLRQAIAQGQIKRNTQIWTEGMADWTPAGNVGDLAGLFPPETRNEPVKKVRVRAYCSATDKSGIGEGPDFNTPRARAVKACLANGGPEHCCPRNVTELK